MDGPWTPHLPQVFLLLGLGEKKLPSMERKNKYKYLTHKIKKHLYLTYRKSIMIIGNKIT